MSILGGLVSGGLGLLGSTMSNKARDAQANQQYQYQKEFAQNGIRWKVADAKAAGIHPLAALGAQTTSYTPQVASGLDTPDFSSMGQSIDRAIEAKQTAGERAYDRMMQKQNMDVDLAIKLEQLKGMRQQNEADMFFNNAKLQAATQQQVNPFPQVNSSGNGVVTRTPYMDPSIPEWGFAHDERGRLTSVIPGDDMSQRTEDKFIIEWLPWIGAAFKNAKAKWFGDNVAGYYWHGEDKGYLPYPPKKKPSSSRSFYDSIRYSRNPYR